MYNFCLKSLDEHSQSHFYFVLFILCSMVHKNWHQLTIIVGAHQIDGWNFAIYFTSSSSSTFIFYVIEFKHIVLLIRNINMKSKLFSIEFKHIVLRISIFLLIKSFLSRKIHINIYFFLNLIHQNRERQV